MGIEELLEQINSKHGAGTAIVGNKIVHCDTISTGSIALDMALGVGGFPRGRISEVFGDESTGKTTICLEAVANVQQEGGMAAYIDVEHALDPVYGEAIGVDWDKMIISQPDSAEQAFDVAGALAESGQVDIIVIDSVAALVPKAELEGDMDQTVMAGTARIMSKALRKIKGHVKNNNCALVFVNQTREKVGLVFGSNKSQPGGKSLKFYASCRIELSKTKTLRKGEDTYGINVKAKVIKNKVAPPARIAEYEIHFGKGICNESSIIDLALKKKVISKNGTFYVIDGEKYNGKANAISFLENNKDVCARLRTAVFGGVVKVEDNNEETFDESAA